MRASWASLGLLLILGACAPSPAIPNVSGTWADEQAAFTVCGEASPIAISLVLSQAGTAVQGTFTLQDNRSAFTGEAEQNRIGGEIRGDDGSGLDAALALQEGRLTGTFTAIEEIGCTDGGSSITLYEVNLARQRAARAARAASSSRPSCAFRSSKPLNFRCERRNVSNDTLSVSP